MNEYHPCPGYEANLAHGILHVVLNRPDVLNRIDQALHHGLISLFNKVNADPDVRVILLSSTGRAFSAGGDINLVQQLHKTPSLAREMFREARELVYGLLHLRVPMVVAVQGSAMGLGSNIALLSDAVVALSSAKFADSHVVIGLVAGDGGVVAWPQGGGVLRAKRHLLTGDPINGEDAYRVGLVTDLVEDAEALLPTAQAIAARIASLPPLAVQGTKKALNQLLLQRAGEAFDLSLSLEAETMVTEDVLEATNAFLERRPGVFRGQ